ncbi:MAG: glycosyltransferase family 2 protein [Alphaproteobacteria bacterium]|nr:glycosyltransferase family 2 protein [Alphaproteobacteria bacterium]
MPLISVVIPTRNRLFYLKDALGSALAQHCNDLEIVVADNATTDGTKEYLVSLGDVIKVTRSEEPLSMTDNWYRGLQLVTGEWVIVIGDDDCLMPDFVSAAKAAIARHPNAEMFDYDIPIYRWPQTLNENERNYLIFSSSSGECTRSSKETLRCVFEEIVGIMSPPGLYHRISKTSLIAKAKERFGEYNLGLVPDHGSGLINLSVTTDYTILSRPLSVMGFSERSTGVSFKTARKDNEVRTEFMRLSNMERILKEKYFIIDLDNADVYQWRLLLYWRDYFERHGIKFAFNHGKMYEYCLNRIWSVPQEDQDELAAKLTEFGVARGIPREQLVSITGVSRSLRPLPAPDCKVLVHNNVVMTRLAFDLDRLPIRSCSQAAELIYACVPGRQRDVAVRKVGE